MSRGRPAWTPPPPDLQSRRLPLIQLAADTPIVRLHALSRDPRFFGRTGGNRFDDPEHAYGVCYLALDDSAAFAETVLRDQFLRDLSRGDLGRLALADGSLGAPARLVEFGSTGLQRLRTVAGTVHAGYEITQAWSRALWLHPDAPDGILYRSRFDDELHCVALFDRAARVLRLPPGPALIALPLRLGALLDRYQLALHD